MSETSREFPIRAAPYQHQRKAAAFALERLESGGGAALLMEMGTGKTLTTIAIVGTLWQEARIQRLLVVAPLSILGVWEDEYDRFAAFDYNLAVLSGMTTFAGKDDVLTLLVHLGYLSFDSERRTISIPNKEVSLEYCNAISTMDWSEVTRSIEASKKLLQSLWAMDEEAVAKGIDQAHDEISILQYNDENSLSCTINLASYYAREYYTIVRELPTGKGFADICLIPRPLHADKPAVVIELKRGKTAQEAIDQIKAKNYVKVLEDYKGNLLLVGINYDKEKKHTCRIEKNSALIMRRMNDESLAKGNFLETNKDVYNGQKRHLDFEWEKQKFSVDLKGKSVRSSVQIPVQSKSGGIFSPYYILSMMCMDSGSSEQYAHAGSSPVSRTTIPTSF